MTDTQVVDLIIAIFQRAIQDILSFPHPDIRYSAKYKRESVQYWAYDARRFINKENPRFQFYCKLLDCDPVNVEKRLIHLIKYYIAKSVYDRRRARYKCNV